MAAIATWGTYNFDDTEVTSLKWETAGIDHVVIDLLTGKPSVQLTGSKLDTISLSMSFRGSTARTRLNDLKTYANARVAQFQQGTTIMGFYVCKRISTNYELVANSELTVLAVDVELMENG